MAHTRSRLAWTLVGLISVVAACGERVQISQSTSGSGASSSSASSTSSSTGSGGCGAGDTICGGACVDLDFDPANCGACGNACPAGGACAIGACVCECPAGSIVCGGCLCVEPQIDPDNCGACGVVCGANSICDAGACACLPMFGDCDGDPSNGCEATLASDDSNCGACGNTCPTPNGTAACIAGVCSCTSCPPGFADCDLSCANGCEANLDSDPHNCGVCGKACAPGQVCANGFCGVF